MSVNRLQKSLLGFFVLLTAYWVFIYFQGTKEGFHNFFYSFLFGLVPLIGGLIGMLSSRIWGWLGSSIGKAVFFFSLGLFLWGSGEMVWSYYNFFAGEPAPYPSLADLGFGPSIAFWALGSVFFSKASGAKFGFRKTSAKILTFVIVAAVLVASYYLQIQIARGGQLLTDPADKLKVILDVAYPLGDVIALMLAAVIFGLSRQYLGGRYRWPILTILTGLGVMYVGDFIFSYTTTVGTYFNADWGDWILSFGLFLMTFGIFGFCVRPDLKREPR